MLTDTDLQTEIHDALQNAILAERAEKVEAEYTVFTITIARGRIGVPYDWSVRHERYGVLRANIPADTQAAAREACAEWLSRWILNDLKD